MEGSLVLIDFDKVRRTRAERAVGILVSTIRNPDDPVFAEIQGTLNMILGPRDTIATPGSPQEQVITTLVNNYQESPSNAKAKLIQQISGLNPHVNTEVLAAIIRLDLETENKNPKLNLTQT